jgi:hypothetical protein
VRSWSTLLDATAPIDPQGLGALRTPLLHLFTVDLLRHKFALARRWGEAAYLGQLDEVMHLISGIRSWPDPPPKADRLGFCYALARETTMAPVLRALARRGSPVGDEQALLSDGLHYARVLWDEEVSVALAQAHESPLGARECARIIKERRYRMELAGNLLEDAGAIRAASRWAREIAGLRQRAPPEHRAWIAAVGPGDGENDLVDFVKARDPVGYATAFPVSWSAATRTQRFPFNVDDKADVLAIHLWALDQFRRPVAVAGPVGLRNFDPSTFWA